MTRWRLLRAELRRKRWQVVGLALSVALGVGLATLVLAASSGARELLRSWLPAGDRTVVVVPARIALGGLGARLDSAAVARLAALPGVDGASPRMMLRVPAMSEYRGAFFGKQLDLALEIAAEGVDPAAVGAALFSGETFAWRPGEPLPACVSAGLLAIYNSTFAPVRDLPQLDARLLRGFQFPLTVGASMLGVGPGAPETLSVRVVCVSPDVLLAGLTLPLEAVRALNQRHGAEAQAFSSIALVARSASDVPAVEREAEAQGFRVDHALQATSDRLGRALELATSLFLGLAGAVLMLAAALVAQAFRARVIARAPELDLLRALGATDRFLRGQLLAESGLVGLCGAALGVTAALLVAPLLDLALRSFGLSLSGSLFRFPIAAWLAPALAGLSTSLAAAAIAVGLSRDVGVTQG